MTLAVRPMEDGDYPRLAEIDEHLNPGEGRSAAQWRAVDRHSGEAGRDRVRLVAVQDAVGLVGWGQTLHDARAGASDTYRLTLSVDPPWQRRGIGSALLARLEIGLRQRRTRVRAVRAQATEARPGGIAFLKHHGFREIGREWQARLAVSGVALSEFALAETRVARQGITLTTLAAERRRAPDPAALLDALHELEAACAADVPRSDPPPPSSPEAHARRLTENLFLVPDGYVLAKDGERFVGLSILSRTDHLPSVLKQDLTGVLRAYRGRGIATALKLQTVRYAREHGYAEIRTWNAAGNAPMLRINDRLGFRKDPVWIEFERRLA